MAVGGGWAVSLGKSGSQGLGVLIAELVPGEGLRIQATTGQQAGHGLEGCGLGASGPWGQAGEVNGYWVAGGVGDRGGQEVSSVCQKSRCTCGNHHSHKEFTGTFHLRTRGTCVSLHGKRMFVVRGPHVRAGEPPALIGHVAAGVEGCPRPGAGHAAVGRAATRRGPSRVSLRDALRQVLTSEDD